MISLPAGSAFRRGFFYMMMAFGLFIIAPVNTAEAQLLSPGEDEFYELQSPESFLGYAMGERLTPHHRVLDYLQHVAKYSNRVELQQYGRTYGGRPLMLAYVTSEENMPRLDEIRHNNLVRAGLRDEPGTELESKAIVWLSYNVHGNETSATEAALFTLHELAREENLRSESYLENTVVIIDPLLNPDGRERYVSWYTQTAGRQPDPYPTSREHIEPWPNGRSNHYNFDLNRDWAWQTQIETRQRLAVYHSWMPHIHADFHEMGINSPYYFAPAAEPFHEAITNWQREFQTTIGENHMRYFDANYRTYFTRESFDLFYPSYGDTYPTYNGAIGMTYEQAGNTQGGLSVITAEGDTLSFERRVLNQHVVGMSTVEVTAAHYERVTEEFFRFFERSAEASYAGFNTYVISGENHPDKMQHLASYLDAWDIRYGRAPERRSERAFDYQSQETRDISISENDLLISARQPKSVLLNVLFEPQTTIIDSLTYDITAWSVPYAMGLEAYALERELEPQEEAEWKPARSATPMQSYEADAAPYAYLAEWSGKQDAYFLSRLLQENIRVRTASQPFSMDGEKTREPGTLIITRRGNESLGDDFDRIVQQIARELDRDLTPVETGFVRSGQDFGSGGVSMLNAPRIALIGGRGVSPYNFGEVWQFLDVQLEYPVSVFEHQDLGRTELSDFDVMVMPEGNYAGRFPEQLKESIAAWVRDGGRLITFGNSAAGLGNELSLLERRERDEEAQEEIDEARQLLRYESRERDRATELITGGIYYVQLDNSHPLAYGYPSFYYTLKRGATAYEYLDAGRGVNVGTLQEGAHRAGFEGYRVKEHIRDSLIFGTSRYGSGQLVYFNDNPLFRAFWHNGSLLFANAVFMVGQ
jgi:hypothetical protein